MATPSLESQAQLREKFCVRVCECVCECAHVCVCVFPSLKFFSSNIQNKICQENEKLSLKTINMPKLEI